MPFLVLVVLVITVIGMVIAGRFVPSLHNIDVLSLLTALGSLGFLSGGQTSKLQTQARFAPEELTFGQLVIEEKWVEAKAQLGVLGTMIDHEIELAQIKNVPPAAK